MSLPYFSCIIWPTIQFSSFALMMQTGAFLQLILTLTAICSRLNTLLVEIREALEASWSAGYSGLQALYVSASRHSFVVRNLKGGLARRCARYRNVGEDVIIYVQHTACGAFSDCVTRS